MVLPDTESISPVTQSLPSPFADGDDVEVGAEPVGLAEFGLASFELPHAARDSAVAPVTAKIAKRDNRVGGIVAGIEVLSILGRSVQTHSGNGFHHRRCR
jgi:hypothetical protein